MPESSSRTDGNNYCSSIRTIIHELILYHRHSGMMLIYCIITGVCVWLSAKNHATFYQWISQSDWSAFLLWHLQFHVWYLLYHALNFGFLGTLRSFERTKARKGQLSHFMNTLIFIILVCGLDIFEGFCWLHWTTPFSFFRMSLIVISERLENPPPPFLSQASRCRKQDDEHAPSLVSLSTSQAPLNGMEEIGAGIFVAGNGRSLNGSRQEEHAHVESKRDAQQDEGRLPTDCRLPTSGDNLTQHDSFHKSADSVSGQEHSPSSPHPTQPLTSNPLINRMTTTDYDAGNSEILILYLLILITILCLWCLCGSLVFTSLPFTSKLMVLYEPLVCCLQWIVVFSCVVLSNSSSPMGITKDGLKFGIKWAGELLCQLLAIFRYAIVWLLFGHSLIFNVVDVLIFMKLKSCFSGLAISIHSLRVFLTVRHILNKEVPTIYPRPKSSSDAQTTPDEQLAQEPSSNDQPARAFMPSLVSDCPETCSSRCSASAGESRRTACCNEKSQSDAALSSSESTTRIMSQCLFRSITRILEVLRFCYSLAVRSSFFSSVHLTKSTPVYPPLLSQYPICVVCRESMTVAKQLRCGHILHQHCLRQWLSTDVTCPICRCPCLTPTDEEALKSLLGRGFPRLPREPDAATQTL